MATSAMRDWMARYCRNAIDVASNMPKPSRANTASTTTAPPMSEAMVSAADVSNVSAEGLNTWRHKIHLLERPLDDAIVTKSSLRVAMVSTRRSLVKVAMVPRDKLSTGSNIDLKCSPTPSAIGMYPSGFTKSSFTPTRNASAKPIAKFGMDAKPKRKLMTLRSVRVSERYAS